MNAKPYVLIPSESAAESFMQRLMDAGLSFERPPSTLSYPRIWFYNYVICRSMASRNAKSVAEWLSSAPPRHRDAKAYTLTNSPAHFISACRAYRAAKI